MPVLTGTYRVSFCQGRPREEDENVERKEQKHIYIRYCVGCVEKLRGIQIAGTGKPRYWVDELPEPPRPGNCPICGRFAHLGLYEMTRNVLPRYRRQTGGGERERAGGPG